MLFNEDKITRDDFWIFDPLNPKFFFNINYKILIKLLLPKINSSFSFYKILLNKLV